MNVFALQLIGILLAVHTFTASAQEPTHSGPMTIIVPYPAGGGNDLFARLIGMKLGSSIGRQVVVDNRSGASGSIGTAFVARAPADGSVVLYAASTIALSNSISANLPYDAGRDLRALTITLTIPFVLAAHPSLPARNAREFIGFVRSRPGMITYSSGGVGSAPHFAMELLNIKAGLKQVHVPYRGAAPALTALVAGEAQASWIVPPLVQPYTKSNKLRALAISSARRSDALPGIMTLREAGVQDYEALQWHGFFVPVKTPANTLSRLHAAISSALDSPEIKVQLAASGATRVTTLPAEAQAFFQKELAEWAKVAKQANITE